MFKMDVRTFWNHHAKLEIETITNERTDPNYRKALQLEIVI